jgi:hypothetical protein
MKSTETYSILRGAIGPWCKSNGFVRVKGGMLGFVKPIGTKFLVFWFQVSRDGWDAYAGSQFTTEFQVSSEDRPGAGGATVVRARLNALLQPEERESLRALQNDVIRRLPAPPPEHYILQMPDERVRVWYRAKFATVSQPYSERDDVWMRYHESADVKRWADFVLPLLPAVSERLSR